MTRLLQSLAMVAFAALLTLPACATPPEEGEIWLDLPELAVHVEQNGSAILPLGKVTYFQIHILSNSVSYGNIHVKINTESANDVMTIRGTANGIVGTVALKQRGFDLIPGRNSVEVDFMDTYRRLHYASYILQVNESPGHQPAITAVPPQRSSGHRYAVVVGIARYQRAGSGLSNLKYADRDAQSFADFLMSPGGGNFPAANILKLFNEEATTQKLRNALFTFLTTPGPEDTVVLYFASHGMPDPHDPRNLYLITYDTDPDDMGGTAFPMFDMQNVFQHVLKARHVITFGDSCHSYGISGEGLGDDKRNAEVFKKQNNLFNQYLSKYAAESDRTVITASAIGEDSIEDDKLDGGHGVFTYFLLKGLRSDADLNKDGTVTAGELLRYLKQKVPSATGDHQHPQAVSGLSTGVPLSGIMVRAQTGQPH